MFAVITGASAGIGESFAKILAKEGYDVMLAARREDRLQKLAKEIEALGKKAYVVAVDLSKREECERLAQEAQKVGPVDLLVNNAGFGAHGVFQGQDLSRLIEMSRLNMEAVVSLTRLFLPGMVSAKKGAIIQVASTGSFQPVPFMSVYAATKAFVLSFTEALSLELSGTGVYVQTLCPGPTATEFNTAAAVSSDVADRAPSYMSPEAVVQTSLRGMRRKKSVVVPGLLNRMGAFWGGLLPRRLVAWFSARIFRPSEK
jgi:short-subunit dehydrogenase